MIASSVTIPGPNGSEIEARLDIGPDMKFSNIWLTLRALVKSDGLPTVDTMTIKLNRGNALALSNVLASWASELPVWPAP
jgi:hypothetical protein